MAKKILIGATALILILAVIPIISGFAADKAKEKMVAAKPDQTAAPCCQAEGVKPCETQKHKEGLLDQLIAAYKADDKKAMGDIIAKMEKRREQMRKFARFERWHQMAHQRMMMQQFCGPNRGGFQGCPGMQMNQNWGPPMGGFKPMPQFKHPGGFGPMPQWQGCPKEPNGQASPPAGKPGAMWNDNDQTPDSQGINAMNDEEAFEGPDSEVAFDNDAQDDSQW
jgi:hypothetical protein